MKNPDDMMYFDISANLKEMKNNTETLLDENGYEILVNYDWEFVDLGDLPLPISENKYVELKSVELIIKGNGIQILQMLNEKQIKKIIGDLTFE